MMGDFYNDKPIGIHAFLQTNGKVSSKNFTKKENQTK